MKLPAKLSEAKLPVEYEAACAALVACTQIDEAKVWGHKADALSAWAKIYRNDEVGRKAKQLKLQAYRRMGELAEELRPTYTGRGSKGKRNPGANRGGAQSLLVESGLIPTHASAAIFLRKISPSRFQEIVNQPRPPSPGSVLFRRKRGSESYRLLMDTHGLMQFAGFARRNSASALARDLHADEVAKIKHYVTAAQEWLDEFEQHLGHGDSGAP